MSKYFSDWEKSVYQGGKKLGSKAYDAGTAAVEKAAAARASSSKWLSSAANKLSQAYKSSIKSDVALDEAADNYTSQKPNQAAKDQKATDAVMQSLQDAQVAKIASQTAQKTAQTPEEQQIAQDMESRADQLIRSAKAKVRSQKTQENQQELRLTSEQGEAYQKYIESIADEKMRSEEMRLHSEHEWDDDESMYLISEIPDEKIRSQAMRSFVQNRVNIYGDFRRKYIQTIPDDEIRTELMKKYAAE